MIGRGGITTGYGIAVPDKVVTNDDLSKILDTNDEWIVERTGIRERRHGGTTSSLAIEAGLAALAKAGRRPDEIDAVILATTTPDQIVPGTSAVVQDGIGVTGGAFDVNAACSGFVYALTVAHGLISVGVAERLLVIGSETLSKITDFTERGVSILVGDGAGAVVVEATDGLDAITKVGAVLPDLILLDWNMPNMDGLTFVQKYRAQGGKALVVMVTTEAEKTRVISAIKAGVKARVVGYPNRTKADEMRAERIVIDGKTIELR
jgi:3-oxoacyl-(acyl-carrier-protein) synthase III